MSKATEPTTGCDHAADSRSFRRALGQFSSGVTIVTAAAGDLLVGVTANSFCSLSLDPPLIMWAVARSSRSFATLMTASHFAVNVLAADQIPLSATFARSVDGKFVGVDWRPGRGGAPVLANVAASFECRRDREHDAGDHVIMVGHVERYERTETEPLLYAQGHYALAVEHPAMRAALQSAERKSDEVAPNDGLLPLLHRASRRVSRAFDEHRKLEGLNSNQSLVLTMVSELPDATMEGLLAMSLMELQDMQDATAALIDLKLLDLSSARTLRLSALGQTRLSALENRTRLFEAGLKKDLKAEDVETTRKVLTSLVENASAHAA